VANAVNNTDLPDLPSLHCQSQYLREFHFLTWNPDWSSNTALEKCFSNLLRTQSETQKILKPAEVSTAATASAIADELSERECKNNSIIVYNLPESPEQSSKDQNFADLCKAIVKVDLNNIIQKMFHIGRKNSNRSRPASLEVSELAVLSNALRLLRFHNSYKKVFIATKFERAKHKKLVEESKQWRQQGETNLIIKNGSIVQRQL